MKLVKNLAKAIKEFKNDRGRKSVQNSNRSANAFDLQPMPAALPFPQRITMVEGTPPPAILIIDVDALPPIPTDISDMDHQPDFDLTYEPLPTAVERMATRRAQEASEGDEREATIIAQQFDPSQKPKGSNAWPWNRRLGCCGKREALCTCGPNRRYI